MEVEEVLMVVEEEVVLEVEQVVEGVVVELANPSPPLFSLH